MSNGKIEESHLYAIPKEIENITITVDRDENSDADFTGLNAITEAFNSISDASPYKRYTIHIRGVFHFTDPIDITMLNSYGNEYSVIDMKPYVDVEGEGPDNTVIFVDLPANAEFPSGFAFDDYQPVFFCGTGGNLKNMKIIGKNCRYSFHIEVGEDVAYIGENIINIDNCEVVSLGAPDYRQDGHMACFGTGMIPGTIWNIRDCKITNEDFNSAFGIHTPLSPFEKCGTANFINCVFKGKMILSNYQVENNTFVNMINCDFNKAQVPRLEYPYYNNRSSGVKRGDYTTQLFNGNKQRLLYNTNSAYENKGAVLRVVSNSTGVSSIVSFNPVASAFNSIIGSSDIDAITKTIYGWDTQYGYVYRNGGVNLSGQAFGTIDVDENSSMGNSLGKKLGDCSSTNKTLIITIDGTDFTVVFNENYSSKNNAYVIGQINDVIGGVATADIFCPAKLYYPNVNGLMEVESGDNGAILKGMGIVFNVDGKMVKAKNSDGKIDGICLDDTSIGQTGRIITMGYIFTHFSTQWFKTVDTLDYVPNVRYGKTLGIDPDNDGQFKQSVEPALLRCKKDCFEIL